MGRETNIQWCDHTFNHVIGCTHVHVGCKNCYAEADMDRRRGRVKWGPHGTRSRTSDAYWRQPLKWNRTAAAHRASWQQACRESNSEFDRVEPYHRPRVFCASLADVFEDWQGPIVDARGNPLTYFEAHDQYIPVSKEDQGMLARRELQQTETSWATMDDLRRDLFAIIDQTPELDWLLLTKRPENVRRMWPTQHGDRLPLAYRQNVWLGYSASDQPTLEQGLPDLLHCGDLCPLLYLSLEPLLGPVDLANVMHRIDGQDLRIDALSGEWSYAHTQTEFTGAPNGAIGWVIVGGESAQPGRPARPMVMDWAAFSILQCGAASVAVFMKQIGSRPEISPGVSALGMSPSTWGPILDPKGGNPAEWPEHLRVQQFPEVRP